jgi:hypothetical protein
MGDYRNISDSPDACTSSVGVVTEGGAAPFVVRPDCSPGTARGECPRSSYLDARNPSDIDTLIDLAAEIGLDRERLSADIASDSVEVRLREEVAFARREPFHGFPSLAIRTESGLHPVEVDYGDAEAMRRQIEAILSAVAAA